MDIEMTLPLPQRPIADGALGDDERTETEKSPMKEGGPPPLPPRVVPPRGSPRGPPGTPDPNDEEMDGLSDGDSPDADGRAKKHRRGKQKGGRRHRQKNWKPYVKLTWEERQKLDEKEMRRAYRRREERFASGQPMAPYNTTQFLMDQHPEGRQQKDAGQDGGAPDGEAPVNDVKDEGVPQNQHPHLPEAMDRDQASGSTESSNSGSESYDSPNDEDIFLEKDFSEAYENCQVERLQEMSKDDLVKELLDLQSKVERMEREKEKMRGQQTDGGEQQNSDSNSPNKPNINNNDSSEHKDIFVKPKIEDMRDPKMLQSLVKKLKEENECLKQENQDLKKKAGDERTTEGW